ncbi:hypothetical protein PSENEW3_00005718 [Picochlorum sp. SENEW3]|nr:hypothetical protein PSENEW3_00005718 [Picochlorum sp. SENEW3]
MEVSCFGYNSSGLSHATCHSRTQILHTWHAGHQRRFRNKNNASKYASVSRGRGVSRSCAVVGTEQPGLLFSTGEPAAWDEAGVGHPIVRYYLGDNEQRWFMWYTGKSTACHDIDGIFPSSGSIGLAVSSDGLQWERGHGPISGARGESRSKDVGKVLQPNEDWWTHDTCHVSVSDVQILSNSAVDSPGGVYWCFYAGGDFEQVQVPEGLRVTDVCPTEREGLRTRPGLAMSQDGRNFARIEGDHHTGALFDVGEPGEWDALFIGAPQVVAAGPRDMRMYYHSYDEKKKRYVVGVATSPDGFRWEKRGPVFDGAPEGAPDDTFDSMGAASRCVVRDIDTKQYFMFYEGVCRAKKRRSIGMAVSKDGISSWKRCDAPILEASEDDECWDSGSVGTPWAVSMAKGRWRLYYSGSDKAHGSSWNGIGVALSDPEGQVFHGAPVTFTKRVA